jgi:hypothetical protein
VHVVAIGRLLKCNSLFLDEKKVFPLNKKISLHSEFLVDSILSFYEKIMSVNKIHNNTIDLYPFPTIPLIVLILTIGHSVDIERLGNIFK